MRSRTSPSLLTAIALAFALAVATGARADDHSLALETHAVEVAEGVTLHVREFGEHPDRPPVLLLTGGPGFSGEQLRSTAEALASTRRVILPDQRGTGASRPPATVIDPTVYNFEQAVADLESVRTALGVERWALAGHSWGGLLCMLYAAEHPDRVEAVALVAPAGIESSFWQSYQQNIMARMTDAQRQSLGTIPRPADQSPASIAAYMLEANKRMSPAMLARPEATEALQAEMTATNMNPIVSLSMQGQLQSYDLRDALAGFDRPVTVIQGDQDPIGRDTVDRIVESLPKAELVVIERCGHWPMFETPDELNAALAGAFGGS